MKILLHGTDGQEKETKVNLEIAKRISRETAELYLCLLVDQVAGRFVLAMVNTANIFALEAVADALGVAVSTEEAPIDGWTAPEEDIRGAIEEVYRETHADEKKAMKDERDIRGQFEDEK